MMSTRAVIIFAFSVLLATGRFGSVVSYENNTIDNIELETPLEKILAGVATDKEYEDFVARNGEEIGEAPDTERNVPAYEGIVSRHLSSEWCCCVENR